MTKTLKTFCMTTILMLGCARIGVIACSCLTDFKRIKSMDDLKAYEFVALVKVTSETVNPFTDTTRFRTAKLGFKIIEKFKGKDIRELTEFDIQSSCEMGIEVGDEWLLFAIIRDGQVSVAACSRNVRYRDKDGVFTPKQSAITRNMIPKAILPNPGITTPTESKSTYTFPNN